MFLHKKCNSIFRNSWGTHKVQQVSSGTFNKIRICSGIASWIHWYVNECKWPMLGPNVFHQNNKTGRLHLPVVSQVTIYINYTSAAFKNIQKLSFAFSNDTSFACNLIKITHFSIPANSTSSLSLRYRSSSITFTRFISSQRIYLRASI